MGKSEVELKSRWGEGAKAKKLLKDREHARSVREKSNPLFAPWLDARNPMGVRKNAQLLLKDEDKVLNGIEKLSRHRYITPDAQKTLLALREEIENRKRGIDVGFAQLKERESRRNQFDKRPVTDQEKHEAEQMVELHGRSGRLAAAMYEINRMLTRVRRVHKNDKDNGFREK